MGTHPPLNGFDIGYVMVGALVVAGAWAAAGTQGAFALGLCMLLSYAAGRGVGAHR